MCYIQIRCESCWFSFVSRCCKLPHIFWTSYKLQELPEIYTWSEFLLPAASMWMKSFIVNFNIILCILTWKMTCDFKSFLFWLDLAISMTWLLQPYDLTQLTWLADESYLTCRWKWLDLAWLRHSSGILSKSLTLASFLLSCKSSKPSASLSEVTLKLINPAPYIIDKSYCSSLHHLNLIYMLSQKGSHTSQAYFKRGLQSVTWVIFLIFFEASNKTLLIIPSLWLAVEEMELTYRSQKKLSVIWTPKYLKLVVARVLPSNL